MGQQVFHFYVEIPVGQQIVIDNLDNNHWDSFSSVYSWKLQASYFTMVGFITETIQIQIQIVDQRQFISWQQFLISVMFLIGPPCTTVSTIMVRTRYHYISFVSESWCVTNVIGADIWKNMFPFQGKVDAQDHSFRRETLLNSNNSRHFATKEKKLQSAIWTMKKKFAMQVFKYI